MKTYYINGLDCANCAMKIENKLNSLPEISRASLNFSTGELRIESAAAPEPLTRLIQETVKKLEPDAVLSQAPVKTHHHHEPHAHKHQHHADNHGCACYNEQCKAGNTPNRKTKRNSALTPLIPLGISLLLLVPALLFSSLPAFFFFLSAGLTAGFPTFWKALKKAAHFTFDEEFLLLVAFVAAFFIGEYLEACLVVILFSFGEYLEDLAVSRSRRSIEALTQIRPETANVISDLQSNQADEVSCELVTPGTLILLRPGERVPLDCEVVSGESQTDNSAITGESIPVSVEKGSALSSGSVNLTAALKCRVTKPFSDSTASRIIEMVKDSAAKKGAAENFITRFAKIYTPVIIVAAVLIAILPPLIGLGTFSRWLYTALILLVAACPCALVISVPLTFFSAIGAASKKGVLIKGGKYVEALSKIDAVAFDKTGTITTGELTIDRIVPCSDQYSAQELLALIAACESFSTHPIAQAIIHAVPKDLIAAKTITEYKEIRGFGISAVIDGKQYLCGSAKLLEQESIATKALPNANLYLADAAQKQVVGYCTLTDSIRPEASKILSELRALGIKEQLLLSGDNETAVKRCADTLKLHYRAGLLPEDKVTEIEQFKTGSHKIAFVGDGINDAPVLAAADVGIAMGLGSDSAIEAADVVLASGTISSLSNGIALAKKGMGIIRFNVVFALSAKLVVFLLALFGLGEMWMAVIADVGVSILSVLNAARLLKSPQ